MPSGKPLNQQTREPRIYEMPPLHAYFGDMFHDVLVELKKDGTWSMLPLTDYASMLVIDFDDLYLWPNYKQRKITG